MRDKQYLNCPDSHKLSRRAGHGGIFVICQMVIYHLSDCFLSLV